MLNKIINISFIAVLLWSGQVVYGSETYEQKYAAQERKLDGLLEQAQNMKRAGQELHRKLQVQNNQLNIRPKEDNTRPKEEKKKDIVNIDNSSENIVWDNGSIKTSIYKKNEILKFIGSDSCIEATASGNVEKINIIFEQKPHNNRAIIYLPCGSKAQIVAQASDGKNNVVDISSWNDISISAQGGITVNVHRPLWSLLIAPGVCVGAIIFYWMFLKK